MKTPCDILLVAVNAGYAHASMSLRCLMANLGELEACASLAEFDSQLEPMQIAEAVIAAGPKIAAFSVYIWNVVVVADVLRIVRAARPGIALVAGGPQIVPDDDPAGILPVCVGFTRPVARSTIRSWVAQGHGVR